LITCKLLFQKSL